MPKRVDPGRRDDSGLAHGAADALLPLPGLFDELPASGENSAHRRAQTLAQVDPDRVQGGGVVGDVDPAGHRGVEEPGPVHVGPQSPFVSDSTDFPQLLQWPDAPSGGIDRLLDGDDAHGGAVPAGRVHEASDLLRREHSCGPVDGVGRGRRQDRRSARFGDERMRRPVQQDHVSRAAMDRQADLVAHGPRRKEDRVLLSQHLRHHLLQLVDRGVLSLLLVSHRGKTGETPHLRSGHAQGVAVQIDLYIGHRFTPGL